jgi:phosphate/sulfate permease
MRATAAAVVGVAVAAAAPPLGAPRRVGVVGAVMVVSPLLGGAAAACLWLSTVLRGIAGRRAAAASAAGDLVLLADLTALALSAGLGLVEALRTSARWVSPGLAGEVRRVLRAVRSSGNAALGEAPGRAAALYRTLAAAVGSGAPLVGVVEGFAAERRHAEHSGRMEAARRLPVRLLVPLALLILPGFVVLAVGPALLDSLARLDT